MAYPIELDRDGNLPQVAWTESVTALGLLMCGAGGLWEASTLVPWAVRPPARPTCSRAHACIPCSSCYKLTEPPAVWRSAYGQRAGSRRRAT